MTFKEWFYTEPHRAKYGSDHPAYLAAQEAWEAAHEACAKLCDRYANSGSDHEAGAALNIQDAIRARSKS